MAVIVINQQLGSRGVELGQLAAKELGFRFLTRSDLISEASQTYKVEAGQFLVIDEHQPHFWERSKFGTAGTNSTELELEVIGTRRNQSAAAKYS